MANHSKGYILTKLRNHPRTDKRGYVFEHILVMESHLGRYLQGEECIHHKDGNPRNNNLNNLQLCRDNSEHKLIHRREKAFKSSGHEDWLMCRLCKQYDSPENLYIRPGTRSHARHRDCWKKYYAERKDHFNALQRIRRTGHDSKVAGSGTVRKRD